MKPLKDVVMCEYKAPEQLETTTASGIIMAKSPEVDLKKPVQTRVLATGSQVKDIKQGDEIIYTRQYAVDKEINGEMYTFLREDDILVIL